MNKHSPRRPAACCKLGALLMISLVISGCSSLGVGVGLPLGPFTIGIGASNAGVSAGVGTSVGPVGVSTSTVIHQPRPPH